MENLSSDGGESARRRFATLRSLNGDVSPLALTSPPGFHRLPRNLRSPLSFDPYASSSDSFDSPYQDSQLARFRGSPRSRGGAFSSIGNIDFPGRSSPLLKSPVSVEEEDVIIMDGIPLHSSSRRSSSPSWLAGKENSPYLPERSRLGTKSQFAQGIEELRLSPSFSKSKNEPCKLSSVEAYDYGSYSHILKVNNGAPPSIEGPSAVETWPTLPAIPPPPVEATSSSTALPALPSKAVADQKGEKAEDYSSSLTGITSKYADWCPLDDGIEAPQTSSSSGKALSREEVNALIEAALYGPSLRSRLPAFSELTEPEEQKGLS